MTFTIPQDFDSRPIAIIGAGTLGRRLATMFASRGGLVKIYDPSPDACLGAVEYVRETVSTVASSLPDGAPGRAVAVCDIASATKRAWLVVESVPEKLELKKAIFNELDSTADRDAVLASNSSSYPTRFLSEEVRQPERVLNMHFFMPPDMRAVELMSSGHTDRHVMDLMLQQLPRFGLVPFEVRTQSTGFIFNRVWAAIKREALDVVANGIATPEELDQMWMLNVGTATGPFRGMDQVGLDVVLDIENHYAAENPHLPIAPRELLRQYVEAGFLGVKSGRGFYADYPVPQKHVPCSEQWSRMRGIWADGPDAGLEDAAWPAPDHPVVKDAPSGTHIETRTSGGLAAARRTAFSLSRASPCDAVGKARNRAR